MSLKPYKLASLKDKIEAIEEKKLEELSAEEKVEAEEVKPRAKAQKK